jgi:starch synthase
VASALRVLMVASEVTPYAKSGGLGDVLAALPGALAALGHEVTVVVPWYRSAGLVETPARTLSIDMGGHTYEATFAVRRDPSGARLVFVGHAAFFDRDGLYGLGSHDYEDNPRRFGFLCLAALEFMRAEGQVVDVVHAHDWQTGLAPVYLRTRYRDDAVLGGAATIFTVHNITFKGLCSSEWLPQLGLDPSLFSIDALEYWLHVSLLKGGILFSDVVTTVSRRYAQELLMPDMAFGFEGVIRARRDDLLGIVNGIDVAAWNPATDAHLPEPYDATSLDGKQAAKRRLLAAYGLPDTPDALERPLVAMIARMVDQKGLDLIADVAARLVSLDATYVVMGEGEPWYEQMWRSLASQYPERVGVRIGFDEGLSHLVEGGADIFMMPSRYEPCGLNQLYSLRYGTVPVVRATGGLAETVEPYDPATGSGTGFVFSEATGDALLSALRAAIAVYRDTPDHWRAVQRAGMARDFSWQASARAYVEAYQQAREKVTRRGRLATDR